ncbi:MAG: superoxide dismutase, Ni [Candidatus Wildermuthbacteria bacterium]|nr:superoxide dismutase, Ni [Candidatus Wildermuthbacteria bacterium]
MLYKLFALIHKIHPARELYAHCDIPCGIYTPEPALTAAHTVAKMVEKIEALPQDMPPTLNTRNSFVRMVQVKEEHAQICKKELLVLWTDYFKPQHLEMFPTLHETFWKAAKLCSKNKQEVSREAAQELIRAVEEIAQMFQKAAAQQ